MNRTVRAAIHEVLDAFELYGTLIAFVVLLCLEVTHSLRREWIDGAILTTLMLLAIGVRQDRKADTNAFNMIRQVMDMVGRERGVTWFPKRTEATPKMAADLARYAKISFLGISLRSLPEYLKGVIQNDGVLPWENIEMCFASEVLGRIYEGDAFRNHLREIRQDIAYLLTEETYRPTLRNLRAINFFQQNEGIVTHTGTMMANGRNTVVYVVDSAVSHCNDTREGLTLRLESFPDESEMQRMRLAHYVNTFDSVRSATRHLGTFQPTAWDRSVSAWNTYSRQPFAMSGIEAMLNFARISSDDRILDLGAGTGTACAAILRRYPNANVTLMDASPQMIMFARRHFANFSSVRVALCNPAQDGEAVDLEADEKFSLILIHQALSDIAESCGSIDAIADWCRRRIEPGGRVVVAAHDGSIQLPRPPEFENWKDPFRTKLVQLLRKASPGVEIKDAPKRWTTDEIENAFTSNGFTYSGPLHKEFFQLNFGDRKCLWQVPAVMNSIVDITKLDSDLVSRSVNQAITPLLSSKTMPRTVAYWTFAY